MYIYIYMFLIYSPFKGRYRGGGYKGLTSLILRASRPRSLDEKLPVFLRLPCGVDEALGSCV